MKGKEKKQKRKEENARLAEKQALVDAANAVGATKLNIQMLFV